MENNNKEEIIKSAADKVDVNLRLLGISFVIFTFIIVVNPQLLKNNILLALQLTLSIPLMMSSIFARQRLAQATKRTREWYNYGFVTFILAYAFQINSIGIMLSYLLSIKIGLIFFLVNIINPITYSYMEVMDDNKKLKSRIYKDLLFISIIILLGVLPSLRVL